jgi:hypothetical protein
MRVTQMALSAGGQILLALSAIAVPAAIIRLGAIPSLEGALALDADVVSILRRICMIIAFVAGYWTYVRMVEKRPAIELSFKPVTIALSGLVGGISIAAPMGALYVAGVYSVTGLGDQGDLTGIALVIFAAALLEEIVFRGVLFGIIERHFGMWVALLAPSVLFSVLHLFNDHWAGWLGVVSVVLLGIMWSLVYFLTRNLWAAAANHALWNFTIFATGLPLTGQQEWRGSAPMQSDYSGAAMWTGGAAGPENSIFVIICIAFIVGALLWVTRKQRSTRNLPTPDSRSVFRQISQSPLDSKG